MAYSEAQTRQLTLGVLAAVVLWILRALVHSDGTWPVAPIAVALDLALVVVQYWAGTIAVAGNPTFASPRSATRVFVVPVMMSIVLAVFDVWNAVAA